MMKRLSVGFAGMLLCSAGLVSGQEGLHASNGERFDFESPTRTIYRDYRGAGGAECFSWDSTPGTTYHSVMSEELAPVSTGDKALIQITFGAQAFINDGDLYNYDGIALRCDATQDGVTVRCTGTNFEPFLTSQDSHGDGQLVYTSFHAALWTDDLDHPVTIGITVATAGASGSLCNPSLTIQYGGGEVSGAAVAPSSVDTDGSVAETQVSALRPKKRRRPDASRRLGLGTPPRSTGGAKR
jgi:hypothetical protein